MATNNINKKRIFQSSETISKEDYNSFEKMGDIKKNQTSEISQPKIINAGKWNKIQPFGIMKNNKSVPLLEEIENW